MVDECKPPYEHRNIEWHWLVNHDYGEPMLEPYNWTEGLWKRESFCKTAGQVAKEGWKYHSPAKQEHTLIAELASSEAARRTLEAENARLREILNVRHNGYCVSGKECVCGGDTAAIQQSCPRWRSLTTQGEG